MVGTVEKPTYLSVKGEDPQAARAFILASQHFYLSTSSEGEKLPS